VTGDVPKQEESLLRYERKYREQRGWAGGGGRPASEGKGGVEKNMTKVSLNEKEKELTQGEGEKASEDGFPAHGGSD